MVQLPAPINPQQIRPLTGTGNLPVSDSKGHVVVIVSDKQELVNGKQNEWYIALTLQVVEGPSSGETGVMRINLGNSSAKAVEIAARQLSSICHAVGYLQPLQQTEVLFNKKFRAVVGLQQDPEAAAKGYTEIKQILDYNGNQPGTDHSASNSPAPAPAPIAPPPQGMAPQPQGGSAQAFPQQGATQQPGAFPTAPQGQAGGFPTPQAPQVPQQQFAPPPPAQQPPQQQFAPQQTAQPQNMAQPQQFAQQPNFQQQPPQQGGFQQPYQNGPAAPQQAPWAQQPRQ